MFSRRVHAAWAASSAGWAGVPPAAKQSSSRFRKEWDRTTPLPPNKTGNPYFSSTSGGMADGVTRQTQQGA